VSCAIEETEIVSIGEGFLACKFPGADFHHREHLITTVYLLWTFRDRDWRSDLPELIRRYNVSQGGQNTDTSGYHHTITLFYIDLVAKALALEPHLDLVRFCRKVLDGPASTKDLMLRYYSRKLLYSVEARKYSIQPDKGDVDFESLLAVDDRQPPPALTGDGEAGRRVARIPEASTSPAVQIRQRI
jgi:hypothetical protein